MTSYRIVGGKKLQGDINISGSKNAVLGILAAAMMLDGPCKIENVPDIVDVQAMLEICETIGAKITPCGEGIYEIDPTNINTFEATHPKVKNIRASYYLLGALLTRFRKATMYMPGGCNFGTRPIDLHLKGFRKMGAQGTRATDIRDGIIRIVAEELKGAHIFLDVVSVGATINLMLAATKANGTTVIENAAKEPHIVDVANFLNAMGADIKGAGTDTIRVRGVPVLPGGYSYSVIPDQIEAGTYMIAAAVTRGDVTIHNLIPKHMEPLTVKMLEMGFNIDQGDDWIRVSIDDDVELEPTNFKTRPYPGFPTDLQPQATVLLCQAHGLSRMHENVWDNRFQYIPELQSMGASITVMERIALVNGPVQFCGAKVAALDLRAGAAMVLAGLAADGVTTIKCANRIERGYEKIVEKLRAVGAEIDHVPDDEDHVVSDGDE
ncbi:MAG: UDP-N-acetylglucosamine 1-carboxyvinyltransferase [Clostridiales bacterium]|nr:UDP-N-acetylglucosamine 1-carboxyvinyltransferase [Clostridiales bacterium]MBR5058495.1 UDP-N-acetylglucosamine 1-carboxyvinyltransferase [Clostridiales bacterium]